MFNSLKAMKPEMVLRFRETLLNAIQWLPIFLIGIVFFYLATGDVPIGTLADYRIKAEMLFGRSMMAIYFGQILQNLLFPLLDEKVLMTENLKTLPAKDYNIMQGRLILHGIMQLVFNTM